MKDLIIKIEGKIADSNFDLWKKELVKQIKAANKELKTDKDFVIAEDLIKQFKEAERSLVDAKASAVEQAEDINKLFDAIDEISETTRQARLGLNKQVEQRKEQIKADLLAEYKLKAVDLYNQQSQDFLLVGPDIYDEAEMDGAIRGKKTLATMEAALVDLVGNIENRITTANEQIELSRKLLNQIDTKYDPAFPDVEILLATPPTELMDVINGRIERYEAQKKAEEEQRKAKEQAEREAEEQARLAEQAEQKRIAAQEQERIDAEKRAQDEVQATQQTPEVTTTFPPDVTERPVQREQYADIPTLGANQAPQTQDDQNVEKFTLTLNLVGSFDDVRSGAVKICTVAQSLSEQGVTLKFKHLKRGF